MSEQQTPGGPDLKEQFERWYEERQQQQKAPRAPRTFEEEMRSYTKTQEEYDAEDFRRHWWMWGSGWRARAEEREAAVAAFEARSQALYQAEQRELREADAEHEARKQAIRQKYRAQQVEVGRERDAVAKAVLEKQLAEFDPEAEKAESVRHSREVQAELRGLYGGDKEYFIANGVEQPRR
jgi:hypothetical protein